MGGWWNTDGRPQAPSGLPYKPILGEGQQSHGKNTMPRQCFTRTQKIRDGREILFSTWNRHSMFVTVFDAVLMTPCLPIL